MLVGATILAGIVILVGLVGIALPILPGLILVLASVAGWALVVSDPIGWWVLGVCAGLAVLGWVLQYLVPGSRMRRAGVPDRTVVVGLLAGIVGFFVVPVVGLPLGFVAGVYLVEAARVGPGRAWPSTVAASKAALVSYGIEFLTGVLLAATWAVGAWQLLR